MTTQTGLNHYQRGLELATAGRHQEGLHCIREHLRLAPNDPQALNDAGAILHCLGQTEDAIGCLTKARSVKADSAEIVWNLVEAYLAGGRAAEAVALFDSMEQLGILSIDVLNRTATLLLDQGRMGLAIDVLVRSRRLWPEQEVLTPMLEVIRSRRPKVAFFRAGAGEDGVLAEICEFVQERFQTEYYQGLGLVSESDASHEAMASLLRWSDIAWFDGGGPMAAEASRLRGDARIVVSVRRSDLCDRWAKDVRWENVSILVQIGSSAVEEVLVEQVPDIRNRTRLVVVPNGVNLQRYVLRRRERGKNLACIGCLTMQANPAFLVQCMQKLHYLDPGYRLSFAGSFESPILEQYIRHMVRTLDLTDVITFEPSFGELNGWLSDKHYIVACGIGEDQIEALLAGMACGLKPIVHNFPGADKLFPPQHLFNIAEQFCEHVLAREYEPEQYRRFVEQRYPLEQQLNRVNGILQQIETEIESRPERAAREASCEIPTRRSPRETRRATP
ncbi:MAG TPA: tetratricopeptide repeat protein [Sedimentisphaerales bacterium]|nr:tetratricopeptide repeat protein [Sedimentisphaerales bacterium]